MNLALRVLVFALFAGQLGLGLHHAAEIHVACAEHGGAAHLGPVATSPFVLERAVHAIDHDDHHHCTLVFAEDLSVELSPLWVSLPPRLIASTPPAPLASADVPPHAARWLIAPKQSPPV